MIKCVGIESPDFQGCETGEVYKYFQDKEWIQCDSETFGFDPHKVSLMCLQLGDYDNQFVIAPNRVTEFKSLLETKRLIFHNAKFDLKFLYKLDIWPRRVYDTFLAETVLSCGLKTVKRGLKDVSKRRLGIDLDKSVRDNIWKEGLTRRVIEYSADDVKYLEKIRDSQLKDLRNNGLTKVVDLENEFVKCLAYIEFSGLKLDESSWVKKCQRDNIALDLAKVKLNEHIIVNNISKFIDPQLDLFNTEKKPSINWSSPAQIVSLFEHLGINTEIIEKGVKKNTVEAKHIGKYRKKYPIVELYLDYKEKEKVVSTYGLNFVSQINPTTGRIHTNFRQIMDTGRTSSGGKNRETKEDYLNFQNIPSDKETRGCIIAEEGNTLIISDFSGQEQIVIANRSLDKNLLKFYDEGLSDMHVFIAQSIYPELKDLTVEEVKALHPEKRQEAKIAGFVIGYGGSPKNIAEQLDKTVEEGQRVFDGYFRTFPGMRDYFEICKREAFERGFILINDISGRKSYMEGYERFIDMQHRMNKRFWDRWKIIKKDETTEIYKQFKERISEYFKIKGAIERKSQNFPIQGSAADISKIAGSNFFQWILDNNLQNEVKMINFIHDEYVVECPDKISNLVLGELQKAMEAAGDIYCKRVKLKAEPKLSKSWIK